MHLKLYLGTGLAVSLLACGPSAPGDSIGRHESSGVAGAGGRCWL